jgi:hypothetical protein
LALIRTSPQQIFSNTKLPLASVFRVESGLAFAPQIHGNIGNYLTVTMQNRTRDSQNRTFKDNRSDLFSVDRPVNDASRDLILPEAFRLSTAKKKRRLSDDPKALTNLPLASVL